MINSTATLTKFINNLQLSSLYVENNFPMPLESSFTMASEDAINYLIGCAIVGSKVAGFFHKVPPFAASIPLRAGCIFVSCELPDDIKVPIFFCRKPEQLCELFPRAIKASTDTNMPVHIVLSTNVLNNYVQQDIPADAQDRVLPYVSHSSISTVWQPQYQQDRLYASYMNVVQSVAYKPATENVSFERTADYFPEFVFPLVTQEQIDIFKNVQQIRTTEKDLRFVHAWVHDLLGLSIDITPSLEPQEAISRVLLCPGCPFMTLYTIKSISNMVVFTSIRCSAIENLYPVVYSNYNEYLGIVSQKTNTPTLFIGTVGDVYVKENDAENGTIILFNDNNARSILPSINAIYKTKNIKNCVLPYSCKNIKKYSPLKPSLKKCTCVEHGTSASCIKNTRCPALMLKDDKIYINKTLCTGCRACVAHCPTKALS